MNDTCPVSGSNCGPTSSTVIGNPNPVNGAYFGQITSNDGNDVNIFNNVLYAPAGKYVYTNFGNTNTNEGYNILYAADGNELMDDYTPAVQDITSDPLFSDSSAPITNEFLFSGFSPGIYAGISYSNDNVSVPALLGLTVTNGMVNIGADQ